MSKIKQKLLGILSKFAESLHCFIGFVRPEKTLIVLCCASAVLMLIRCFFGTEFTDEAYYVSDALTIMHGNIPYAYNFSVAAGQSFIPIVFYKIYEFFVPDMDGIFLYSRLCYTFFRFAIIFAILFLLKKRLDRKWRLIILAVLLPFMVSFAPNFSYNTISGCLSLLISIWLFCIDDTSHQKIGYFICGVLMALTVFAHAVYAFAIPVYIVLIIINSKNNQRIRNAILFCIGGIAQIAVVLVGILAQTGRDKLIYGIQTMLEIRQDMGNPSVIEKFRSMVGSCVIIFADMIVIAAAFWILLVFAKKFTKDNDLIRAQRNILVLQMLAVIFSILFAWTHNSCKYVYLVCACICLLMLLKPAEYNNYQAFLASVAVASMFGAVRAWATKDIKTFGVACLGVFIFMMLTKRNWKRNNIGWYVGLPMIVLILGLAIVSLTGNRFGVCVPMLICFIYSAAKEKNKFLYNVFALFAVFMSIVLIDLDYGYVYRDASINNLDTKVTSGAFKGIYTTEARARDIVLLDEYIDEHISDDETVSFRDNAPIGYLMKYKNICDIRTWDEMQWTYDCNDSRSMYRYYENREEIPDVICYIDFGRDEEGLSIDNSDDDFQFNEFVKKYYTLTDDDFESETFMQVKIYRYNGTFDANYDSLINSVKLKVEE